MVDKLERFVGGHETLFDLAARGLANRGGRRTATTALIHPWS
jgi:hypothetical protein